MILKQKTKSLRPFVTQPPRRRDSKVPYPLADVRSKLQECSSARCLSVLRTNWNL